MNTIQGRHVIGWAFYSLAGMALAQVERDPFQQLLTPVCPAPEETVVSWRLLGTVGSGARWYGWGVDGSEQWLQFIPGGTLAASAWQVVQVAADSVQLRRTDESTGRCAEDRYWQLRLTDQ